MSRLHPLIDKAAVAGEWSGLARRGLRIPFSTKRPVAERVLAYLLNAGAYLSHRRRGWPFPCGFEREVAVPSACIHFGRCIATKGRLSTQRLDHMRKALVVLAALTTLALGATTEAFARGGH